MLGRLDAPLVAQDMLQRIMFNGRALRLPFFACEQVFNELLVSGWHQWPPAHRGQHLPMGVHLACLLEENLPEDLSRCRTDVFDDCAVPRLFVDIVKLPLKPSFGYFGRSKKPDRHRQLKYL